MRQTVQRAFSSFLAVPTVVILGFVLLAFGSYSLEEAEFGFLVPLRDFMKSHVFGDAASTSALLGTIASGVITITSITFSLLLLALQQSAGSLTHEVFDQFLRRRMNQMYFGVFVGVTLYALITLATVDPPFNPVLGASLALLFTIFALYTLLVLIYSTINQMRPTEIIKTIHDHTIRARERQIDFVERTRRTPEISVTEPVTVASDHDGYVISINLDVIGRVIENATAPAEITLLVSIGNYVAFQNPLAEVRASQSDDAPAIAEAVRQAIGYGRQRELVTDPAFGVQQLETIAWRSISTSQQNPSPGLSTIHNLQDLLARWSQPRDAQPGEEPLPVVYPDNVMETLFGTIESLSVVASEAMQHQSLAAIFHCVTNVFERLTVADQQAAVNLMSRAMSGMGDHVLTTQLEHAIVELIATLERTEYYQAAAMVRTALEQLRMSVGELNSRSTRVPPAG